MLTPGRRPLAMRHARLRMAERRQQVAALTIIKSDSSDLARYARWNACRQEVFHVELGWQLVPDPAAAPWTDLNDAHATFFSAEKDSAIVGIVRNLRTEFAFPHRELFEAHLAATGLDGAIGLIGTVNALAVTPRERRRLFVNDAGQRATAASLLVAASLADFEQCGIRVVLATVLSVVSARTFMRAGFRILDVPARSANDPRFILANIGKVLHAPPANAGITALHDQHLIESVRDYFDQREHSVLSTGTLKDLFSVE